MRRVVRTTGLCVVALLVLGLSACDVGPAVLQGTLTHTDTGEPLADVPVRVYSSTDESVVARGRTSDDGTYRFTSAALPDGTYRVVFSGDHWWESGTSWDTATDVTVSTGQAARADAALVPTTATLWGDVFYRGSYPASFLPVQIYRADTGELVASTMSQDWSIGDPVEGEPCSGRSSTGCYDVELPAGHRYWVRSDGEFATVGGSFEIELGPEGRQLDLSTEYMAFFQGRIVDPLGVPIAGARVIFIPSQSPVPPMPIEVTTDADGTWSSGVYTGEYHLGIVGPDGTSTLAATPPPRRSFLPARSSAWMSGTSRSAGPDPSITVRVDDPPTDRPRGTRLPECRARST
jgi:5-hydroxyisourate hydrolase-like protein (transthyretin family)